MNGSWQEHLEQDILPWWNERAVDAELGGVFTNVDNAGSLLSTNKYTWSQGRWAWLAAELAEEVAAGTIADADADVVAWTDRAKRTASFLYEHAVRADGRTVFLTSRQGRPIPAEPGGDVATSVFADLFAALGLGAAARVHPAQGEDWLRAAGRILHRAESDWQARTARSEPYPVPAGFRDLAGPMNLLHTAAEMLRARSACPMTAAFWQEIDGVRTRALTLLIGPDGFLGDPTWWEFAPDDAQRADALLGTHRTPGHLLEALWMIAHAQAQSGESPHWQRLVRLGQRALDIGWDARDSGILRYTHADGGPPRGDLLDPAHPTPYESLVDDTWDTKLWWVHAESVYTTALLRPYSEDMAQWHRRISDYTYATFPDPAQGEWIQVRGRDGHPLDKVVALPVKDPFHVIRSLIFLSRIERRS